MFLKYVIGAKIILTGHLQFQSAYNVPTIQPRLIAKLKFLQSQTFLYF